MSYKSKKEFTLEKRVERFKKQFIRSYGKGGNFQPVNVGTLYENLVPWFNRIIYELDLVPVYITMTFRNIPKGFKGYQLINDNVNFFYRRTLLPFLVHRQRYHKFKEQHPIIIALPEYGRGEQDDWHLHGFVFLKREARQKALRKENQLLLNNAFRNTHGCNVEFHLAKNTNADDLREMTAYNLKKITGIGQTLKDEGILFVWS